MTRLESQSMTRVTCQSHFENIIKHLIDKKQIVCANRTRFFCFSDEWYWCKFSVFIGSPSGIMLHFWCDLCHIFKLQLRSCSKIFQSGSSVKGNFWPL